MVPNGQPIANKSQIRWNARLCSALWLSSDQFGRKTHSFVSLRSIAVAIDSYVRLYEFRLRLAYILLPCCRETSPQLKENTEMLRTANHIIGYAIAGADGEVGHCADFLFQDGNWAIT